MIFFLSASVSLWLKLNHYEREGILEGNTKEKLSIRSIFTSQNKSQKKSGQTHTLYLCEYFATSKGMPLAECSNIFLFFIRVLVAFIITYEFALKKNHSNS